MLHKTFKKTAWPTIKKKQGKNTSGVPIITITTAAFAKSICSYKDGSRYKQKAERSLINLVLYGQGQGSFLKVREARRRRVTSKKWRSGYARRARSANTVRSVQPTTQERHPRRTALVRFGRTGADSWMACPTFPAVPIETQPRKRVRESIRTIAWRTRRVEPLDLASGAVRSFFSRRERTRQARRLCPRK